MKLTYLAIVLLAVAPFARAQESPPKNEPPPKQDKPDSASEREKSRALQQADEAVRRAAQNQQNQGIGGGGGGGMRYAPQRLAKPVKAAWLGLTASPPPPALRHQLKLPDGTGLVVDFVQPKSPADQAGIRQYDLLTRLDDQMLINPEQLAVLVRTFKPNQEIHLTYFREGEQHTQSVMLVEHELPPLDDLRWQFNGDVNFRPNAPNPVRINPPGPAQGTSGAVTDGANDIRSRSLTWLDGRQQITVNLSDDQKALTITDNRTNKVIYQGPINDDEQQRPLPREARDAVQRVRAFLKSNPDLNNPGAEYPKGF
jgi:hypothetical protein